MARILPHTPPQLCIVAIVTSTAPQPRNDELKANHPSVLKTE